MRFWSLFLSAFLLCVNALLCLEHTYRYDSLGNRLEKDGEKYEINRLCQITRDPNATYEYDLCGNLISDGEYYFTYDSLDRLTSIRKDDILIAFTYDPFNRRLSKKVFNNDKLIKTQLFIWDGDNEIGSTDENGNIEELRIHGEGLGGSEIGAAVFIEIHGKTYIPIHDHRGCLVALIDPETKKPVQTYRYSAFGEELTGNTLSPWRFASKRVDEETGLVYFGRRYYSPPLGRWITPDPQGFDDGPNVYAYLHNSPLTDFDPYGL